MDVIVIFGPPAVGKMAVGMELSKRTGYLLFHNHMVIELLLNLFPYGSESFNRLRREFRNRIIEELALSGTPGVIFTYVWALDVQADAEELEYYMKGLGVGLGDVKFVELFADQVTRIERNRGELRLAEKKSKRNLEWSEANLKESDEMYVLNSDGDFPWPQHIKIDNSALEPFQVCDRVIAHFSLSEASSGI